MTDLLAESPLAGFAAIGTPTSLGWLYECNGWPTIEGCEHYLVVQQRLVETGILVSGWLICFGLTDTGGNDPSIVLTYCPDCARTVREQEPELIRVGDPYQLTLFELG